MLKGLKKLEALVFMLATIILLGLPQQIKAADKMEAVYVQVPEDWSSPCIWAWDDDGNNAFDAWPGGEFTEDKENDGWYYTWIPTWANHVIVNADGGEVQTGEIIVDSKDMWITITDADNAEVSYDAKTKGDIPEYVEKFKVHVSVDSSWEKPCLWAWSAPDGTNAFEAWPGEEMKETDDGAYEIAIPTWVNSIIVNANNGEIQTEDISIDSAELWVNVEKDGTYEFSYDDPNAESVPDVKLYVIAPSDWENPCLWAWSAPDGTNAFSAWPGEALEDNKDGWLVKSIPGWVNSVIVNGNEGAVQTSDISIDTGKDVWLVVDDAENYTVYYEQPEIDSTDVNVDSSEVNTLATNGTDSESSSNGVNPVVIIVILVVVAGIACVIIALKKKRND